MRTSVGRARMGIAIFDGILSSWEPAYIEFSGKMLVPEQKSS